MGHPQLRPQPHLAHSHSQVPSEFRGLSLSGFRQTWATCCSRFYNLELYPPSRPASLLPAQGKFIRIHFGTTGKLAGADIESCKSGPCGGFFHYIKCGAILSVACLKPSLSGLPLRLCVLGRGKNEPMTGYRTALYGEEPCIQAEGGELTGILLILFQIS